MSTLNEIKNALNKAMDLVLEYEKEQVTEPVKFSFAKFKNHEIAVHCKTKEGAKMFMAYLVGKGLKWRNDDEISITATAWNIYEENTTYEFDEFDDLETYPISEQEDWPEIKVVPFNPQDLD